MTTQLEVTRLWNDGVLKSDQKDFAGALEILKKITDPTSKVTFDIGCLCLLNGDLNTAVEVKLNKTFEQWACRICHTLCGISGLLAYFIFFLFVAVS